MFESYDFSNPNTKRKFFVNFIKLDIYESPFTLFQSISKQFGQAFIFESLHVGPKELSEISIIGFDPEITIEFNFHEIRIFNRKKQVIFEKRLYENEDPFSFLNNILVEIQDHRFRYIGGAVGYVSYDAINYWESISNFKYKDSESHFPLIEFGIYTDGLIFDNTKNEIYYFYIDESRLDNIITISKKEHTFSNDFIFHDMKKNMGKEEFVNLVKKAKSLIYDGEIFQVVLSKRTSFDVKGNLLKIYESLRHINPSPYMFCYNSNEHWIIGSSPEMLIRVSNKTIQTFPIAGTRKVGRDKEENEKLALELKNDEKEIAEHTMLVDLSRNDMGKICEFDSVIVNDLMTIKKFSHVQHIVSEVKGRIKNSESSYSALKALFPAGTVSGAPKIRAMEIIYDLEPSARGPYAGALGYFSFNGSCDFAITIRSIFTNKNNGFIQSGAGIVIDSDPEKEWEETEQKANALIEALKKAKN